MEFYLKCQAFIKLTVLWRTTRYRKWSIAVSTIRTDTQKLVLRQLDLIRTINQRRKTQREYKHLLTFSNSFHPSALVIKTLRHRVLGGEKSKYPKYRLQTGTNYSAMLPPDSQWLHEWFGS
jgi:hypothetical protein